MDSQQQTDKQQARKKKEIERFIKQSNNKQVHDLHLIDGKPQLVCSLCDGTNFSFVTGWFWFILPFTTFFRICNTCGKRSRHGGTIS